jgi:hypothetical protein
VVVDGDIRSCYPQRVEFLRSARDINDYQQYTEMFAELYEDVAVPKTAGQWIAGLQHQAAQRGMHRALSAVDLRRPLRITASPCFMTTTTSSRPRGWPSLSSWVEAPAP